MAAKTRLADELMGPTPADRLALAEQLVKTLAPKSQKEYFGRLKAFQVRQKNCIIL
jgi:hypothetical protein